MPDPLSFTSTTARYQLPYIISGQAQRELSVNQAHALADALLHPAIQGETDMPPASPADGECWVVGPAPTGEWAGRAGMLACRQADTWLFVTPREGFSALDKAAGQTARFDGAWQRAVAVTVPSGGATVDTEARAAIADLIAALVAGGILPA
jgi:hypothetical protein